MKTDKGKAQAGLSVEQTIEASDWVPARKDLYLSFWKSLDEDQKREFGQKRFRQWLKSSRFRELAKSVTQQAMTTFRISGMVMIMMATVVLHFLFSVFTEEYFLGFSVDAVVASLCAAFLYTNARSQFRMLRSFGIARNYVTMDLLGVLLCILVELMVSFLHIDLSIIILIGIYFIEKRNFTLFLKETWWNSL